MTKKRIGIIGGGISGTALGYHLSLYDNAEIVIFEKDTIGGASTAKSAGTATITVKNANGTKSAICEVNVIEGQGYLLGSGNTDSSK